MSRLDRLWRRDLPAPAAIPTTKWCVVDCDNQWFAAPVGSATTVGCRALELATIQHAARILESVTDDAYRRYLAQFYRMGIERCGGSWHYADINTVLIAAATLLQPEAYLEIGVRTGRSAAMLSSAAPDCAIVGFDLWIQDYAGMPNPGPRAVTGFLHGVGHRGPIEFVSGDSRTTVPAYFAAYPEAFFDVITVDGDHSREGARVDLVNVKERVKVGGVLVFDDISNASHAWLLDVWREVVTNDGRFSCWEFTDVGFGVACAVRLR